VSAALDGKVVAVGEGCAPREGLPIIPPRRWHQPERRVVAVEGGVMIALTRMNRVLNVDFENRRALVEAGCLEC